MGDVEIPIWLRGLRLAPEYHPTETEFADPIAYISKIEKEASAFGICKVIPPLPKPSKRYVISNLNKSLSKCPELGVDGTSCSSSQMGFGDRGNEGEVRAVFTTRHQELGLCAKRLKGPMPVRQLAIQKQVWQSGEVYTLDQFESKSKAFARSHLSGVKEVSPLVVESLFWKAASEKPIYVEYANDVPGSGFGEPEEPLRYFHKRKRRRRRFDRKYPERVDCDNREARPPVAETFNSDKAIPCSSTLSLDESSRLEKQKSLTNDGGSDREGTAGWKISNSPWNLQVISRSRGSLTRFMTDDIPGVTSPMVYIGMLFSWFAWHVEDHELHSLNFLHMGAPKTWYAIPGDYAFALEEVVRMQGYGGHPDRLAAITLLGEKTTLLSPEVVISSGIPCCRLVQHPGEFVVTFPRAYHVGFSHGFNCGEAANFATPQWLKVAKEAAVRRAAMNYLPMLSHQQLLYLLTMSFVSSVPRALLPGVRSSRLKDRKKEEREILVKKAFLDDMMTENRRLVVLLGKSSTSYAVLWDPDQLPSQDNGLASFTSGSLEPSSLAVGAKQFEYEKDGSYKENAMHDDATTLSGKTSSIDWQNYDNHDDKVNSTSPYVEAMDPLYADDDDLPCGLHVDSGTLACVACGVLGFPFMSVVQPSERASKEIFHGECEVIQAGPGNMRSVKIPTPNVDKVVKDFHSDDAKTVYVDFEARGERDEIQTGNLYPRCGEHTPAKEVPKAGRTFKLVENGLLECSSDNTNILPEITAGKDLKQTNILCHTIRASSSSELNQSPIHCENNISPIPSFSQISISMSITTPNDSGHETYQISPITDMANQNDMQIDNSEESGRNTHLKVDATVGKDLKSRSSPKSRSGDEVNRQWNTTNVFLRPRIFCLEHAVEIEELLQCQGGANVLVICHSDYPKIKAQTPFIAEEIGTHFNSKDIPLEIASQADLDLINISIDDENEECREDWTSKLGLNLRYCVKLRKLSPSKQERHALALGGMFSDQVLGLNISTLKWQSRKSRTHHKGTGLLSHSSLQDNLHIQKSEDKMGSHSSGDVFIKNQVSGSMSEPSVVAQACRSRGRGRPRKHTLKESDSGGNETVGDDKRDSDNMSDKRDPDNMSSGNACGQPAHSNEKVENDSAQVVNSSTIADPTPKSSEAQEEILTTHETNMTGETRDSSVLPISHIVDIPMGDVSENQQQIHTPNSTSLADEVFYSERSACLLEIAISEDPTTVETKKAVKVCDSTSSIRVLNSGTPEVESSQMQQHMWSVEETTMEDEICDSTTICIVENSETQEEIHTTEGTPMVGEVCDSAKLPSQPTLADSTAKSSKMQQEIQNIEETSTTDASCYSKRSADLAAVSILMAEHSDMQPEIQTTDETSAEDDHPHDFVKPGLLPTIGISIVKNSEMTLDIQTAMEDNGPMDEVCCPSKLAGLPTMSISMVGNSEMQEDTQAIDETKPLGKVCSSKGGVERANANPILVYSRARRDQHKRKGLINEKTDTQDHSYGFIRSPCEGLRPRTGRDAAGEMDASRTVEEKRHRKKAKTMPDSSDGCRDEEKRNASYACDLDGCRMSFTTKAELQLHKRNQCTHKGCGKRFSSHKYAMRHQRVHNNDRPLKCPWKGCDMSFKWAWARTEHMRLHTGERPYQCKVTGCGLTFMFVSDFSRHRRKTGHSTS